MKTSIYRPKKIAKILLIVCAVCVSTVIFFLLTPNSWENVVFPLIAPTFLIVRFMRDRIELSDEYIYNKNAYMNKMVALDKIEDVEYESHWYGEGAVITFRNNFDILSKMKISSEYEVEEIVEEIHTRKCK